VSWPSKRIVPRVGAYRPTIIRAIVDLPQPDSPTSASVSPALIENETPSTARSSSRGWRSSTRLSHGAETSKYLATSVSSTSGRAAAAPGPGCG
jgi:hypothetical protein